METKIVRLSSGEEIICKSEMVDQDGIEFIKIKNPAILVPVGDGQLAFAPWLPYGDITDGLQIEKKFIVFRNSGVNQRVVKKNCFNNFPTPKNHKVNR